MKNWRTTLSGTIAGVMELWANGGFDGTNYRAWGFAVMLVVSGIMAKDAGVTGPGI